MKIFHFDFNTAFFRMDYLKGFIRDLRSWGYDGILWELEDLVRWETFPQAAQCDSISKTELLELLNFAEELGMKNIPLLQCLGHCEYVLQHPEYNHLSDTPGKWSPYCPSNPEVRQMLQAWLEEYLSVFSHSEFFHLGCDEVWHLGDVCPVCKKRIDNGEKALLMAEHINFLAGIAAQNGKTPMIWADMLLIHPEMTGHIDQNIIMVDWRYELRDDRNKLWLWNDRGGYLIDEADITDTMRKNFAPYLYRNGKVNPYYTTDFLADKHFKVINAGASSSFPDNFILGNASGHIHNACRMMKKGAENLGYIHTSWTVHLFFYELQPAIEMVRPTADCDAVMNEYTQKYFGIDGKEFFAALDMLAPRVLFSGAESTGCGKAVKDAPTGIIQTRLQEFHEQGILERDLEKTVSLRKDFTCAVEKLFSLRKKIKKGDELFDLYILAAKALLNRVEFGILAASEFLKLPHDIDREKVKAELLEFQQLYLPEYMKRQTPEHARRMVHTLFGTLLEYLG